MRSSATLDNTITPSVIYHKMKKRTKFANMALFRANLQLYGAQAHIVFRMAKSSKRICVAVCPSIYKSRANAKVGGFGDSNNDDMDAYYTESSASSGSEEDDFSHDKGDGHVNSVDPCIDSDDESGCFYDDPFGLSHSQDDLDDTPSAFVDVSFVSLGGGPSAPSGNNFVGLDGGPSVFGSGSPSMLADGRLFSLGDHSLVGFGSGSVGSVRDVLVGCGSIRTFGSRGKGLIGIGFGKDKSLVSKKGVHGRQANICTFRMIGYFSKRTKMVHLSKKSQLDHSDGCPCPVLR